MTPNEVARTDLTSMTPTHTKNISGMSKENKKSWRQYYEKMNKAADQCPYCKNQETHLVINKMDLEPYLTYWGKDKFKVWICLCCGGQWHYEANGLRYVIIDNDK